MAGAAAQRPTAAAATATRQPCGDDRRVSALFLRPTGLADGLVPKERHYETHSTRLSSIRPPVARGANRPAHHRLVPPFPPGAAREDSADLQSGGSIDLRSAESATRQVVAPGVPVSRFRV